MRGLRAPTVLTVALVVAALGACAGAATVVVDTLGTGDYTAIRPALTAAAEDDTVLVLPGTYTGPANRNLFGLGYTKNVVLRSRDGALATIIDCGEVNGNRGINFIGGGQDSTCVVDGFTIMRGKFSTTDGGGTGIRCEMNASPTLRNLIIKGNNTSAANGGGLYCNNYASPIVRNVLFENNHAQAGGGLYCNMTSQPKLRGVTFRQNYAVTRGGGACCLAGCDAWFSDVVFEGNTTDRQGAGFACFESSPALMDVVFVGNAAHDYGGAIDIQDNCSPFFLNCTLSGNSAPEGGAIHVTGTSFPTITNSIVAFTGSGASTFYCDGTSTPTITKCVVFANAPGDSLCGDNYDNAFLDPLFCDVTTGDLTLASDSPCLPGSAQNPWGELVGALGQGCENSPVEPSSWGRIKCLFK
jgi:hypothetical protein